MPDRTPEQPPSWPPAGDSAAPPTNPPRITARGVGHVPHDEPPQAPEAPLQNESTFDPSTAGGQGYALPQQWGGQADQAYESGYDAGLSGEAAYAPAPAAAPGLGTAAPTDAGNDGGAAGSTEWPPRETHDWMSRHAQPSGWNDPGDYRQGATWPGPTIDDSFRRDEPQAEQPAAYESQLGTAAPPRPEAPPEPPQQPPAPAAAPETPQAEPDAPAAAPPQAEPSARPAPPPTHQGVRYAIYGIGGLITLGLIIAIIIMLGGPPASEPSNPGGGDTAGDPGPVEERAEIGLSPERYDELAAAVGTDAWFAWRNGTAGENAAPGAVPEADGGALASGPLYGDASRNVQGQLAYVTDDAGLSGLDHVTVVESSGSSIGVAPRAGGRFSDHGSPELELNEGSTADCLAALGGGLGEPVAMARAHGPEINAHAVTVFSNGVLATTGISGAQGGTCLALPSGHVPTGVALSSNNEIAVVTTWVAEERTGALVVVALADQPGSYQSSWSEPYLGLPNPGHFGAAEVVGTVALPVDAPTAVAVWSDATGSSGLTRSTVADGAHADTVAQNAYAIVGSLEEHQITLVDLSAVLTGLAAQHYDGADFAFSAEIVDTARLDGPVADVGALDGGFAAATRDGAVHEFDTSLAETGAVAVGGGVSCIEPGAQSGAYIVTSRGDASVSWVRGGEVAGELRDSRLVGPSCALETPALGVGSANVLLVADYDGQALHGYLMEPATLGDGGTVGADGISYGGAYSAPGRPFAVSVTLDLE